MNQLAEALPTTGEGDDGVIVCDLPTEVPETRETKLERNLKIGALGELFVRYSNLPVSLYNRFYSEVLTTPLPFPDL